jgi:hypothetical protein
MFLLVIISTFSQFQLEFLHTRQIVLYSIKGMRIERDQLFLQLHDVFFIDFVKQRLCLLLELMREVDSNDVKMNLLRDIGHDEPHNVILLAIKN